MESKLIQKVRTYSPTIRKIGEIIPNISKITTSYKLREQSVKIHISYDLLSATMGHVTYQGIM